MDMRGICAFGHQSALSHRNIRDSHKITSSQCIEIGSFWTDISSGSCDGMYLDDSFFMKSECPEKCKKIICSRITIDEYLRYFCGMCIEHITIIHYFLVFCKRIFSHFFLIEKFQSRIQPTPQVIAISAILKTAKCCTLIKSVTEPNILRSIALRSHPIIISMYPIFSLSDISFHDIDIK